MRNGFLNLGLLVCGTVWYGRFRMNLPLHLPNNLIIGKWWCYKDGDRKHLRQYSKVHRFITQIIKLSMIGVVETHILYRAINKQKVNQSLHSPEQALRIPGSWVSQISWQSTYEDGKVVSLTHRPRSPPKKHSWYSLLLEAESTPGPLCGRKGL